MGEALLIILIRLSLMSMQQFSYYLPPHSFFPPPCSHFAARAWPRALPSPLRGYVRFTRAHHPPMYNTLHRQPLPSHPPPPRHFHPLTHAELIYVSSKRVWKA